MIHSNVESTLLLCEFVSLLKQVFVTYKCIRLSHSFIFIGMPSAYSAWGNIQSAKELFSQAHRYVT